MAADRFLPEPCEAFERCLNRPDARRPGPSACGECRFAQSLGGTRNLWKPAKKGEKHPMATAARQAAKRAVQTARRAQSRLRDPLKRAVARQARQAEHRTGRAIIQATKNSGRSHRDGDHTMAGKITLDTKSQKRLHPVVQIGEMEKVREDARRAGNPFGALVLRNCHGRGFVVLAEEDFARLVGDSL